MQELFGNLWNLQWQQVVMWGIGGLLIWLAIKKEMEPSLLLPMGFGAILVNLPLSGAVTQVLSTGTEVGPLDVLFDAGIANELFPLLLFVGIGAMIDFTPLLSNPKLMIFGAAAQFGIFFTLGAAAWMGFELKDAASIAVIGAADGPTSIFVANFLESNYLGAIIVAAYSYMALVPIIQPPVIRLVTTKKERLIRMPYAEKQVSKTAKILFPIIITMVAGLFVPRSVALVGFLMFGNLIRECGVLDSLSETAQKVLANLITLLLGLTVASKMQAEYFLNRQTLMILALGLVGSGVMLTFPRQLAGLLHNELAAPSIQVLAPALLAVFSLLGLALSLSVQNCLSNAMSGIIILLTRPFEDGDFIEAGNVSGTVRDIGLIYTQLCTIDNKDIYVPNSDLSASKIVNYNREPQRRVDLTFGADYTCRPEQVKAALHNAVSLVPGILPEPAPFVRVAGYGESNIDYVVRVWCKTADYWTVYYDLMEAVGAVFDAHGVSMSYPQMNVHVLDTPESAKKD